MLTQPELKLTAKQALTLREIADETFTAYQTSAGTLRQLVNLGLIGPAQGGTYQLTGAGFTALLPVRKADALAALRRAKLARVATAAPGGDDVIYVVVNKASLRSWLENTDDEAFGKVMWDLAPNGTFYWN